jgi:hypothetical protein
MPTEIPHDLTSAAQAGAALEAFLGQLPAEPDWMTWPWPERAAVMAPMFRHQQLLTRLDHDPGPGPAVEVAGRRLGNPPTDRPVLVIQEPAHNDYGVIISDPVAELAGLVSDVATLRALAARAARCAEAERDRGGRHREAQRLDREAGELVACAAELEAYVNPLGAHFLGVWRSRAASQAPAEPTHPITKAVRLR